MKSWPRWRVLAAVGIPMLGLLSPAAAADRPAEPERAHWPARTTGGDLFAPRSLPRASVDAGAALPPPLPWRLVAVREEPARLRLIGHTGAGRNLRGVFALPGGGTALAKIGESVGADGLTVQALELRRSRGKGSAPRQLRAVLIRQPGRESVTLETDDSATPPGLRVAVLRRAGSDETVEVRSGERFGSQAGPYTAGPIELAPASLVVTWTDEAGTGQQRVLRVDGTQAFTPEKGPP